MGEVVPTGKRLRILQLLVQHGTMTGRQLLDADKNLPSGTIYTTLRRLEDDGFVTSRQDKTPGLSAQAKGPKLRSTIKTLLPYFGGPTMAVQTMATKIRRISQGR